MRTRAFDLDPVSGLPVKETSISLADPDHPDLSETRYEEWKEIQGIRFAHRFTKFRAGLHVADAILGETRLNSGLRLEDLKTKPSDLKPVMDR